jgi:hypothetical protein
MLERVHEVPQRREAARTSRALKADRSGTRGFRTRQRVSNRKVGQRGTTESPSVARGSRLRINRICRCPRGSAEVVQRLVALPSGTHVSASALNRQRGITVRSMNDQAALAQVAAPTHQRPRRIAIILGSLLLVVAAVGAWASHQGYIVITSVACTDQGYRGPIPSFEHLVNEEHLSPYCARRVRGETWW